MAQEYVESGVLFLRSLNIKPYQLDLADCRYITPEFNSRIRKSELHPGDIVVVRTGVPGTCTIIPDNIAISNCSDLVIIRAGSQLDNKYFMYFMNSKGKEHVQQMIVGAVQQHFNVASARELPILLPPLPEQRAIAGVLSSLDDKIDLLRRENRTLEAMAETLFRQWFAPAGAGGEEADEGWEEGKLGDYLSITSGKGLKKDDFNVNGLYPVLGANGIIGRSDNFLYNEKLIYTGRVGTLGKIFIIKKEKVWLSDNTLVIRPKDFFYTIYFILRISKLEEFNVGSTQPLIRQSDIKEIDISLPPKNIIESFEPIVSVWFRKIEKNLNQIELLTQLRDTLLPKLMSGEVRVAVGE